MVICRFTLLRIPLIPKINDNIANARLTAEFIADKMHDRIEMLQLLKYMPLGEEKYRSLDQPYEFENYDYNKTAFDSRCENIKEFFASRGIPCMIGTATKEN